MNPKLGLLTLSVVPFLGLASTANASTVNRTDGSANAKQAQPVPPPGATRVPVRPVTPPPPNSGVNRNGVPPARNGVPAPPARNGVPQVGRNGVPGGG